MSNPYPAGATAETLIVVGLVLQGISVLVVLIVGTFLLVFPLLGGVLLLLGFLGIVWLVLVYVFSYSRTVTGDFEGASAPTLVFSILSLLTLGILPGILYLVAWIKLSDAVREKAAHPTAAYPTFGALRFSATPGVPAGASGTAPGTDRPVASLLARSGSNFCARCGWPIGSPTRYCPNCGALLA
jgi:hypothetical protein